MCSLVSQLVVQILRSVRPEKLQGWNTHKMIKEKLSTKAIEWNQLWSGSRVKKRYRLCTPNSATTLSLNMVNSRWTSTVSDSCISSNKRIDSDPCKPGFKLTRWAEVSTTNSVWELLARQSTWMLNSVAVWHWLKRVNQPMLSLIRHPWISSSAVDLLPYLIPSTLLYRLLNKVRLVALAIWKASSHPHTKVTLALLDYLSEVRWMHRWPSLSW